MPLAATGLVLRILPPEEWDRIAEIEPFATHGLPEKTESWVIIVAEVEGEIVGFCGLFQTTHWEPWWIAPEYQRHPGVVRGLLSAGKLLLEQSGIDSVFACTDNPKVEQLLERLGFISSPGKLYLVFVPEMPDF